MTPSFVDIIFPAGAPPASIPASAPFLSPLMFLCWQVFHPSQGKRRIQPDRVATAAPPLSLPHSAKLSKEPQPRTPHQRTKARMLVFQNSSSRSSLIESWIHLRILLDVLFLTHPVHRAASKFRIEHQQFQSSFRIKNHKYRRNGNPSLLRPLHPLRRLHPRQRQRRDTLPIRRRHPHRARDNPTRPRAHYKPEHPLPSLSGLPAGCPLDLRRRPPARLRLSRL